MGVVEVPQSEIKRAKPSGTRWWVLTLAGAAAFWLANLIISLTPSATGYRSALSIQHLSMLVEAAVGGLVLAGIVAFALVRFPERIPGGGPVPKALILSVGTLLVVTALIEVPSKFGSGIADPGHWLFVATLFNAVRVLAMGLAIGLVAHARGTRGERRRVVSGQKKNP